MRRVLTKSNLEISIWDFPIAEKAESKREISFRPFRFGYIAEQRDVGGDHLTDAPVTRIDW
jgi:hypothetical protein